jgi:hypothetical protein
MNKTNLLMLRKTTDSVANDNTQASNRKCIHRCVPDSFSKLGEFQNEIVVDISNMIFGAE